MSNLSIETFLDYLTTYNEAIFPMQIFAYILGIIAVIFAFKETRLASRIISSILALMCLWVGLGFGLPFALQGEIIGILTATLFSILGALFVWQAIRPGIVFGTSSKSFTWLGFLFISFAMVGYPILGYFVGHVYPQSMSFGLTPCPLAIFTLGLFMLTSKKVPRVLLILPFFYSISGVIPFALGIPEDLGLVFSGLVCVPLIYLRDNNPKPGIE